MIGNTSAMHASALPVRFLIAPSSLDPCERILYPSIENAKPFASRFLDVADAFEVGVELFQAAVAVFAEQDEDQVEQMLER